MAVKTKEEYVERLKVMNRNVYIGGKKVDRLDERLRPCINVICVTFDMANNPEFEDLCTATSHITGEKVNRFCHIHQSREDLLKKQEMTRILCHRTGGCIGRCMGVDAMNALSVVTKLIDMKYNTNYYERFINYLKHIQANDLVANCAQTDVKGDRIKRPHEQRDPDLYLRIVEKRDDGIIVRGAKAHNSIAPCADEIIALPTRNLTKEEGDWAVAFAVPADDPGVKLVVRPAYLRKRKKLDAPIVNFGTAESLTIFDDVFVPWERVFMCGEWEFARALALLFALYHRHSYTGCKPAVTDVLCGTAALVAECNNIERETHVRDKLAKYITISELVYAAGIASAHYAFKSPSGTCIPDPVYVNAGRKIAGENIYHEYEILTDLAGGLACTLPFEEDFYSEETGSLLNKYIMRNPNLPPEYVHRAFRLAENIVASDLTGVFQGAGVHGGGSPIMETITIMASYNIEKVKDIARYLAGIKKELPRLKREELVKFL
ncbi:MAG: 4-hydroxyphenylacetate 3-hydroxylase N-terminal domain-containing protein [Candidatus Bathyarchaeia archaeon]